MKCPKIYLDGSKDRELFNSNIEKQKTKLSDNINKKFVDIKNILISNYINEYYVIINSNYQKLLAFIIISICNEYKQKNKKKGHIIVSYYESQFILNLCKKLLKTGLIEDLTIINHIDIINEFKKNKKNNTIFGFISNINMGIYYNLDKLSSFCKYFNIILISNNQECIFNYTMNVNDKIRNKYNDGQDIILLNYYKSNTAICKIKKIIIKKYNKLLLNNECKRLFEDTITKESLLYNLNIISYYKSYEINYNAVNQIYNNFFKGLNEKYRIIDYNIFIKTDPIYFNNSSVIITFNNIGESIQLNNIIFSIHISNVKFTSTTISNYLKENNIITNTNNKYPAGVSKEIINGCININISKIIKQTDINRLIKVIDEFISQKNVPLKKTKKHIRFSTPESIILTKPYKKKVKQLKSILKKKIKIN